MAARVRLREIANDEGNRLRFVLDNFSAHQGEVREWAADNNVELAHTHTTARG